MTGCPSDRAVLAAHPTTKFGRYYWLAAVVESCYNWLSFYFRDVNLAIDLYVSTHF
jgi:hypothetical protein